MNTETSIIPVSQIAEFRSLSKELATSQMLPMALRKKPEDILAVVLTGAELGLAPMGSLRAIHIINGKPTLAADLMGALCKSRSAVCKFLQLVDSNDKIATYLTHRVGDPEPTRLSFTIEQAEQARLLGNDNWKKYPAAMLRARALAAICRAVYPDIILGLYDPDELTEAAPAVNDAASAPQKQHAKAVADALKASSVDGEVVTSVPVAPPAAPVTFEERIAAAVSAEALKAMIPDLKQLPDAEAARLRPIFNAKRAALVAA